MGLRNLSGSGTGGLRNLSEGGSGGLLNLTEAGALQSHGVFQVDAETISASNGDTIQSWADQIGSNDLSGGDPEYRTDQNIAPTVRGDRTDDELINTSPSGLPTGNSERTIILVMESESAATSDETIFSYGQNNTAQQVTITNRSGSSDGELRLSTNGGDLVVDSFFAADAKHLLTIRYPSNATAFDGDIRDKGSQLTTSTAGSDQTLDTTLNYIAAFAENGANYSGDTLSEAIIYDSELTGTTLDDEEQRLADKWGITLA